MKRFQTFLPAVALLLLAFSCGKGPAAPGDPTIAAAYRILCRETDKSEWMPALPMDLPDQVQAGVTEFRCPLSKDNYYFAVRAVSAGGHPGMPAVAR